jgi:hypothetical protein
MTEEPPKLTDFELEPKKIEIVLYKFPKIPWYRMLWYTITRRKPIRIKVNYTGKSLLSDEKIGKLK